MSNYYLDASALAKRYLTEPGTTWLRALVDPASGNTIWLAEITQVEVAAALAARHRIPRGLTLRERDRAVRLLRRHALLEHRLASATPAILDHAIELTQQHRLRGYDSVQLATALAAEATLRAAGLPALTFVAARAERLITDDPNRHP